MTNKRCRIHFGDVLGDFEVISKDINREKYKYYYICRCRKCGFEKSIAYTSLVSMKSIKCNSCNDEFAKTNIIKGYQNNLAGMRFGKLVVESFAETKNSHSRWNCICDCCKREVRSITYLMSNKYPTCKMCSKFKIRPKKENEIEVNGDIVIINKKIIIDFQDLDLIKSFNRYISINTAGYAYFKFNNDDIFIHRLLFNLPYRYNSEDRSIVDHINGNKLDNRRENLRLCKKNMNPINCKLYKTNTSGQKGVGYLKRLGKWQSQITYQNKTYYLGVFDSFEDAVCARKRAEKRLYKGFNRE